MGKEMMAVMGMPCNDALAKSAGVPSYDFTGLSNSALASWLGVCFLFGMSLPQIDFFYVLEAKLAGNGMDVPSVGFILMAVWRPICQTLQTSMCLFPFYSWNTFWVW